MSPVPPEHRHLLPLHPPVRKLLEAKDCLARAANAARTETTP